MSTMFEKASRLNLRFGSPVGLLSVEDLWNLPLSSASGKANLDDIAIGLRRQLKTTEEESFVKSSQKDDTLQLQFDIVKHIIDVRLAENAIAATKRQNNEKRQQILSLIAQKEAEHLSGQSLEDLRALAESLQ